MSIGTTSQELSRALLPPNATLRDALQTIDQGSLQVALSCDDQGVLRGLLTDGNIRRALLAGASLESSVEPYLRRDFIHLSPTDSRAAALDLMQSLRIKHVPILAQDRRLVGLHLIDYLVSPALLPNQAFVLAGGQGRRLRPYTEHLPKPMLKVAGRPILERLVLHLAGHGIRRITLATGYLAHLVEEHFQDGRRFGCEISYLREETPLGTAGPLGLLRPRPVDPLLVLNGDLVTQFDVQQMLTRHQAEGNHLTVGVKVYSHQVPFGCVTVQDGRVQSVEEKPSLVRLVNAGIYVLQPEVVAAIAERQPLQMPDLIGQLLEQGRPVGAFELTDDWIDVGLKENLEKAREGVQ